MGYCDATYLLAKMGSGARIRIWTGSVAEAELIAEAFHEARPNWALSIDGCKAVFSREGKIVDLSMPASGSIGLVGQIYALEPGPIKG